MANLLVIIGCVLQFLMASYDIPPELSSFPLCAGSFKKAADLLNAEYQPAIGYSDVLGECHFKDFKIIRTIGKGNFGKVSLALHKPSGIKVALKEVVHLNPKLKPKLRAEECYQHILDHPNIVRHFCSMSDESMLYFAMEYVEGNELRPILRREKSSRRFSTEEKKRILLQIVDALRYMHTKGIIYGDLKSANIILLKDNTIKLIDFGLSLWTPPHQSISSASSFKNSFAIDWFLFGVLLFEFAADGKVFRDYCPDPIHWRKLQRKIKCPCSKLECDLINALVLERSRPLSEDTYLDLIYNHTYFKS